VLNQRAARAFLDSGWDAVALHLAPAEAHSEDPQIGSEPSEPLPSETLSSEPLPEGALQALGLSIVRSAVALWATLALVGESAEVLGVVISDRCASRRLRSVAARRGMSAANGGPGPYLDSLGWKAAGGVAPGGASGVPSAMDTVAADFDLGRLPTGGAITGQ
jgi:hypothetical protein